VIGGLLLPHLTTRYRVRALDIEPVSAAEVVALRGSVTDDALVAELVSGCSFVVHLATASGRGWPGLLEVDIAGTRTVFDAAVAAGVVRVVFASTNHVAGGIELDAGSGRARGGGERVDVVRPDSPYAAAKAFGEAYGRFVSETSATAVSCLRIGSVRPKGARSEAPPVEIAPYWPPELLAPDTLAARIERTRLLTDDLVAIVDEELAARERFRLRWAVSDNPGRPWPLKVAAWNP